MSLSIKSRGRLWVACKDNKEAYSGSYRQVEDWLDSVENVARTALKNALAAPRLNPKLPTSAFITQATTVCSS
jgi:hypothetical protein